MPSSSEGGRTLQGNLARIPEPRKGAPGCGVSSAIATGHPAPGVPYPSRDIRFRAMTRTLYRTAARFVLCEFLGSHGPTTNRDAWSGRRVCSLCGDLRL